MDDKAMRNGGVPPPSEGAAHDGSLQCERLRDYLLRNGPATVRDVLGILAVSRAEAYQIVRRAARLGHIKAVAHVHTDDNHRSVAWDVDSMNGEFVWRRRQERIRGRYCTCPSRVEQAEGVGAG